MTVLIIITMLFGSMQPSPPDTLTLEYCYSRIENHYPIAKKIELQKQVTDLNKKIISTGSYPQFNLSASATYQSEVTEFQVPAGGGQPIGPDLSKDQYKATMDITQSIYNGGAIGTQKELEEVKGEQQLNAVKVQLHSIKEQVNTVYFGILLSNQQSNILNSVSENLRAQIRSVKSKVVNGVVLPTQLHILEAELLKVQQDSSEIEANIQSGFGVLSQLIGEELKTDLALKVPETKEENLIQGTPEQLRPEFDLFESNRKALEYQKELARTNKVPSLSAFGTAAYGRPGFNVFENDLHGYYIVGLKLQWNFWGAQNTSVKQEVYSLQQKSINEEEAAFNRQLQASLNKIKEEIRSLENIIERDEEIISLREKVIKVVSSQLKNGTATATEYITELNKATQARVSLMMNRIKLAQARVDYKTTLGVQYNNR